MAASRNGSLVLSDDVSGDSSGIKCTIYIVINSNVYRAILPA